MTKIDWSLAPKEATHYAPENNAFSEVWIKKLTDTSYFFTRVGKNQDWTNAGDIIENELEGLVKRPSKPLYTKEFRVLGGTNEVWQKCKVVFKGKRYTVVENENGKEFSRKTAKIMIRDIDTRTDTEKSLDSLMDSYWDDNNEKLSRHSPIVKTILNAIKDGKIHNVTFTGSK